MHLSTLTTQKARLWHSKTAHNARFSLLIKGKHVLGLNPFPLLSSGGGKSCLPAAR